MTRHVLGILLATATLICAPSVSAAQVSTVFTGHAGGVDLDVPIPGFDLDAGSIVNTGADLVGGAIVPRAPGGFALADDGFSVQFGGLGDGGVPLHFVIPELYVINLGGFNAWGVHGAGFGTITFSTPATVSVHARGSNAAQFSPTDPEFEGNVLPFTGFGALDDADASLRAFGTGGALVAEIGLSNNEYLEIFLGTPISRLEIHNAGGANSFAVLGQLTASPVPLPPALGLFALASATLGFRRRRR